MLVNSISGLRLVVPLPPGIREDIIGGRRKHLASFKMTYRKGFNHEPALILALSKIRPRIEVLA
jgi:hypothetical protein